MLKKRYLEMRADKLDLFNTKPTGKISWDGREQHFRQWQTVLRGYLESEDAMNCKDYPVRCLVLGNETTSNATLPRMSHDAERVSGYLDQIAKSRP